MTTKNLALGFGGVVVAFVLGWFIANTPAQPLGSVVGPEVIQRMFFYNDIIVPTQNTATSSIVVGCLQMTATSTASPVRLIVTSYATTTATFGAGTSGYAVVALPGTCPSVARGIF